MGPIFSEWNGSEIAKAASGWIARSGERRMNAAVFAKATLTVLNEDLRLDHELQTAMGRQRQARPQFLSLAYGMARHRASCTRVGREVPAVLIFRGRRSCFAPSSAPGSSKPDLAQNEHSAPKRLESAVRLAPVNFLGEPNACERHRMP
jgi:hypothetical protein